MTQAAVEPQPRQQRNKHNRSRFNQLDKQRQLYVLLKEQQRRQSRRRIDTFYPTTGPLSYDNYPKHYELFAAGKTHPERCFMAGNRVGKSEGGGGFETALHLTGLYPDWWPGYRFDRPVKAWMAGKTNETTRDIVQAKICGPVRYEGSKRVLAGTGLIPGDMIGEISFKQGVKDMLDTVYVKHVSGGWSQLQVKSYQQGRGSFEGTEQDLIWLDEEPPLDIYGECVIRTMTTHGMVILTFTPLEGMSEVVLQFLPRGVMRQLKEEAKQESEGIASN